MFRRAPVRVTEITYRFLAPVLSAQLITAPTGRPSVILNLFPVAPPRPMNYSVRSQRTTLSSSSHSWIRELYGERTADGGPPEYLQNRGRRLFSQGESHPWMNVEEVSSMLLLFHGYYFCFMSACNSACLFKPVHYDMCIPVTIHTNTCCHT